MKNLPIKIKKTLRLKYRQTFKTTEFILKERKTRYQTRIFSFKKISSPSRWWYQLVWHGIGQPNHFLSMDEEWKWMQKHTSDMYRKNFYLPFNAFINIKIGFCTKQCSITRFEPRTRFFYNKHSIHVLSKHMNGPRRHLTAIPSITIFGIKWKKKYMKIDFNKPFENETELKKQIERVWKLPSVYRRFEEQSNSSKVNLSKWFMVKIYQSFDSLFVQFQVFDTVSSSF